MEEKKNANAEIEVEASAVRVTSDITIEKREAAKKQAAIVGHPLCEKRRFALSSYEGQI